MSDVFVVFSFQQLQNTKNVETLYKQVSDVVQLRPKYVDVDV